MFQFYQFLFALPAPTPDTEMFVGLRQVTNSDSAEMYKYLGLTDYIIP